MSKRLSLEVTVADDVTYEEWDRATWHLFDNPWVEGVAHGNHAACVVPWWKRWRALRAWRGGHQIPPFVPWFDLGGAP